MFPERFWLRLKFLKKVTSGKYYNVWVVKHEGDIFELMAVKWLEFTPNLISRVWIEHRIANETTFLKKGELRYHRMTAYVITHKFN